MNRFAFQKENGEVLRLILTKEQLKVEEFILALASWKKSMRLFSTGEDTHYRQGEQIIFSDDILRIGTIDYYIVLENGKWFAKGEDEGFRKIEDLIPRAFIIEPYPMETAKPLEA